MINPPTALPSSIDDGSLRAGSREPNVRVLQNEEYLRLVSERDVARGALDRVEAFERSARAKLEQRGYKPRDQTAFLVLDGIRKALEGEG